MNAPHQPADADPPQATEHTADVQPDPPPPLLAPAEGVPVVQTDARQFAATATRLANGIGPVALDTERASGFRYSNRAYLVQIRRSGAGTHLIDPIDDPAALTPVIDAIDGPEWVLHAADQDLPSLHELGFRCAKLFDTELGGRLLNLPKVNLATMVATFLNLGLTKGHGADDWSTRPLPHEWLVYAALDVEVLVELRDVVAQALEEAGKLDWAREEFDYIRTKPAAPPRTQRWRRTSGIHTLRNPRQVATVKELWDTREEVAARRDVAPGRVLPDSAIISAAIAQPTSLHELTKLPIFGGARQRRWATQWFGAIERARALPDDALPGKQQPPAIPAPSRWGQRNPEAAQRYSRARCAITEVAAEHDLPVENLLQPDTLRGLCWEGIAEPVTDEAVDARLVASHARGWQRALCVPALTAALTED